MRRRCRGRPRCPRFIGIQPTTKYFLPLPAEHEPEIVPLSLEELETVRLVDLEELEQETAAQRMGISRKAFWIDLQNARKKIADALVNGKGIEIVDGNPEGHAPVLEEETKEVKEMYGRGGWNQQWPGRGPFSHLPPWQRPGWLYGKCACWWWHMHPSGSSPDTPMPALSEKEEELILKQRLAILEKEVERIKARLAELQK